MEPGLIGFAVIPLHALLSLVFYNPLRAVFREAKLDPRVCFMKLIQPLVDRVIGLHIPAEIQVIALQIGNPVHRRGDAAHHHLRGGGGPGGIKPVRQIVERADALLQRFGFAAHGDLILHTPAIDAGVAFILRDQFRELLLCVFKFGVDKVRDDRYLRPNQKAHFVACVVEPLILLVMRKANRICPDLADESEILPVLLFRERIAHMIAILMPGNAL